MDSNKETEQQNSAPSSVKLVMLDSWGISKLGTKRLENQDSFLNWPEHMVWAVADGLGGSDHGGAASQLLVRSLLDLGRYASFEEQLENAKRIIGEANTLLLQQSRTGQSAASTIVCLLVHEGNAACLWSGDSRCYLLRGGQLYQCTKDHTLRQEKIDSGELTAAEAERMVNSNIVTRAIGVKEEDFFEEVRFTLHAGDRFLLCSDGLSAVLEPELLPVMLSAASAKKCVEKIVEYIADKEQPDNITLVAICLSGMV